MRALLPDERSILEFLLSKDFRGVDQLIAQLEHVSVTGSSCGCGCDSVGLAVEPSVSPAQVDERVPTDAFGRDAKGIEVGVVLHVIEGYMADLEFYSTSDAHPFGRPVVDSLRLAEWVEMGERVRTLHPRPSSPVEE